MACVVKEHLAQVSCLLQACGFLWLSSGHLSWWEEFLATETSLLAHHKYSNIMPFPPKKVLSIFILKSTIWSILLCSFENTLTCIKYCVSRTKWILFWLYYAFFSCLYWEWAMFYIFIGYFYAVKWLFLWAIFVLQLSFSHCLIGSITYSLNCFIDV